tara:strand:- start:1765 stop:1959 length:195 start_codon:yes stop_codon:yes gene_type:complete
MIHASKLFPLALDRIHDHLNRGNPSSDNPETKRKVERKAGDRGPIRVKRKRVGAKQMELPLTHK